MRYRVHGVSRTTGKETTLLVNAKHHEAAEAVARRELIVSRVEPEGGLTEMEVFDPRALDQPATAISTIPATTATRVPRVRARHSFLAILLVVCLIILAGALVMVFVRHHP